MDECSICFELYNKKKHKIVECFSCEKKTCVSCVKKFLLEKSYTEPRCLHCNQKWDRRFMIQNLPKKFCNIEYRHQRRNVIFEKIKSYLPKISKIITEKQKIEEIDNEISILKKQINILEENKTQLEIKIDDLEQKFSSGEELDDTKKNKIGRPCVSENCLGFLDENGKCPICLKKTCLICNVSKENNHKCKEVDKKQWECIEKSTKPCPKCHVRIYKISGCDQMWCTNCQTPFSWKHGTIDFGYIHNYHYFDFIVNRQTRNLNSIGNCENRLLGFSYFSNLKTKKKLEKNDMTYIMNLYKHIEYVSENLIAKLLGIENLILGIYDWNDEESYRRRILPYLLKIIYENEESSKILVEKYDYNISCDIEFSHILNTYLRQQIYLINLILIEKDFSYEHFYDLTKKNQLLYMEFINEFEKVHQKKYKKISRLIKYSY